MVDLGLLEAADNEYQAQRAFDESTAIPQFSNSCTSIR